MCSLIGPSSPFVLPQGFLLRPERLLPVAVLGLEGEVIASDRLLEAFFRDRHGLMAAGVEQCRELHAGGDQMHVFAGEHLGDVALGSAPLGQRREARA